MTGEVITLPYLHERVYETRTPYGFPEVQNTELYRGESIRNRVIVKVDLFYALTDFFSKETLDKYRDIIYLVISGSLNSKEKISKIVESLYLSDTTFRKFLGEVFYFGDQQNSLYYSVVSEVVKKYRALLSYYSDALEGKRHKILFESKGCLFLAIPDERVSLWLLNGAKEEVLSRGKVWSGSIQRFG